MIDKLKERVAVLTADRDRIILQLQTLENAKQQLLNQLNAHAGAIQELTSIINREEQFREDA